MHKILTFTTLLLSASTALAEDYSLYCIDSKGTLATQHWEVTQLKKITFEDGLMNVVTTDGTTTPLPASDIQRLIFYTEEGLTDIEDIQHDAKQPQQHEVHDLMGRPIHAVPDQLPKGLYIIDGKKTLIK